MRSPTYGEVSFEKMSQIIKCFISEEKDKQYRITIGTDSQNHDLTKVVIVAAVWKVGYGGIFFYDIRYIKKITNIRQKIFYETSLSLEMAKKLSDTFVSEYVDFDIDIHVDAGENGPSSKIISEIVGWVKACGFKCHTKPESYAASCIANRFSK
ncbi:MAG: ribonuclease H-like YkuK family protein [Bacillota bacterium]